MKETQGSAGIALLERVELPVLEVVQPGRLRIRANNPKM
jgi:hypothetical protein